MNTWMKVIFRITSDIWPFPTYSMGYNDNLHLKSVVYKTFEVSTQIISIFDLIPRILLWKTSL